MKVRKVFLAIILLGLSFCFVSGVGYGEVDVLSHEISATYMEITLLNARINYIMTNPTSFLVVSFSYDPTGLHGKIAGLPESVDTKGKISIVIGDNRGTFSDKSWKALLNSLKRELEIIYSYIQLVATDMDADIVARFYSREEIPLAYFSEGEYHLWEE